MCLLYVGVNMLRAPHARGHVHMPFYEGTWPKKSKKSNLLGGHEEDIIELNIEVCEFPNAAIHVAIQTESTEALHFAVDWKMCVH